MDVAHNPLHAERARRKNRSSTNVNHLSLAPLTTKMPLAGTGGDDYAASHHHRSAVSTSYIEGRSVPTTPRLLSRTPGVSPRSRSRVSHSRTGSGAGTGPSTPAVARSKSTTQLSATGGSGSRHHCRSRTGGATTPHARSSTGASRRRAVNDGAPTAADSDWLFRTGALMSTEARESKGQAWLVSRQSSTSLRGDADADNEAAFDEERRRGSRRGSSVTSREGPIYSRTHSRFTSRANSASRRSAVASPMVPLSGPGQGDSYFASPSPLDADDGPDFVNLDEKLEQLEEEATQDGNDDEDEAAVRRLVRRGKADKGSWLTSVFGWSLFSVEENDDEEDEEEEEEEEEEYDESYEDDEAHSRPAGRSSWSARHFEGVSNAPEARVPPPKTDEGMWGDAAWLLSVATKVLL